MTRTERLLRLARLRGDRAAELILLAMRADCTCGHSIRDHGLSGKGGTVCWVSVCDCGIAQVTEAELRAAWGDR